MYMHINLYHIDDYDLYTSSRTNKNGGGVAIYVRNIYKTNIVDGLTNVIENCMETLGIEITLSKKKIYMDSMYLWYISHVYKENHSLCVILF